jgi:gamma-glutamyl:cysteine ligase YbdK (ATP-grasp superfamily)
MEGQALTTNKDTTPVILARFSAEINNLTEQLKADRVDRADLRNTVTRVASKLSGLEASLHGVKDELTQLLRLVRDGNGAPSVMQRVITAELAVDELRKDVGGLDGRTSKLDDDIQQHASARVLAKWQVIAGALGIIATLIVSVMTAVISALR